MKLTFFRTTNLDAPGRNESTARVLRMGAAGACVLLAGASALPFASPAQAKPSTKPSGAKAAPTSSRFPTPTGVIKYHITTSGRGTLVNDSTMSWANYGRLFRLDSQMRVTAGKRSKNVNSWTIFDGKALYTTVPDGLPGEPAGSKIAVRMTLPPNFIENMMAGNAMAHQGRVVGRETLLGKSCEVRVVPIKNASMSGQFRVWTWQKLALRSEMTVNRKVGNTSEKITMSQRATALNTTFVPSPALFRLPAGYKARDLKELQQQMQNQMQNRKKAS